MRWTKWMKVHKSEIVVGVVVSLVTALILEIGDIFMLLIPKAGNSIWATLVDGLYRCAGRFNNVTLVSLLSCFLISVFVSAVLSFVLSVFKTIKRVQSDKQLELVLEKAEANPTGELSNDELRILEENTKQKRKAPSIAKIKGMLWFLITYSVVFFATIVYSTIIPADLYSEFDRHITQIAPYVTDSEVLMLRSQWVSMQNRHDYEVIYEYIENVRNEQGLQ